MRTFVLSVGLMFVCLSLGCSTPTKVQPLADPIFRLNTTLAPTGCNPGQDKLPCRWDILGIIQSVEIVSQGDNPFQDCSTCRFSQKFGVLDGSGTIHYVYYKLPTDEVVLVSVGDKVKLSFIKADSSGQGYAMSLRNEDDKLFVAIASGAAGELIKGLLGSFDIVVNQEEEAGREISDCGTKVFRYLVFKTDAGSTQLAPGQSGNVKDATGQNYRVANVNRYNWEGSKCSNLGATPFSYFILKSNL